MTGFDESQHGADVVRLMEEGFLDGVVRLLRSQNPDAGDDVEDAVANAVLKLVTRTTNGAPVTDVRAYLFTAARNGVYDAHARMRRLEDFDPERHDVLGLPADHALLQKEAYRAVQTLVRRWPNRNLREYMLLYLDALYQDEPLTLTDAAEKLSDLFGEQVNLLSIGTWKRRALAKLLQDFEDQRSDDAGTANKRTD